MSNQFYGDNVNKKYSYQNKVKVHFSTREYDVVREVIIGKKDTEIAQSLCLSVPTIRKNLNSIYNKCNVYSKVAFIASYYMGGFDINFESKN